MHATVVQGNALKKTLIALLGLVLAGCPKPVPQETTSTPTVPELTLTVASLDLSTLNRRLTKSDVQNLWSVVRKEKFDVLTVQNLTRYPGLTTRVDLVKEFSSLSDWRSVFGELIDNSGAQEGNAVFAAYPIRSHSVSSFEGIKGVFNEGSLAAVVDGGLRDILIVSASLPEKGGEKVKQECFDRIAAQRVSDTMPVIVSGNLPKDADGWKPLPPPIKGTPMLFDGEGTLDALRAWTVPTALGLISASTFGIYRAYQQTTP